MHNILDCILVLALAAQSAVIYVLTHKAKVAEIEQKVEEKVVNEVPPILYGAICDMCKCHVNKYTVKDGQVICNNHAEYHN